ncbi:hypothetical protein ACO0K9_22165 [Undibacterium sp. Ji50W]|uniref:hypothetical protein n=1 Tax=Undibacterium sp. Ji50W TaxID=3413041 RepID=UPI003BF3AAA1
MYTYTCSSCREKFFLPFTDACYYLGPKPVGKQVADDDVLKVLVRHAWCRDCSSLCIAEDILALREFENAYGSARAGRSIEYPVQSEYMDEAEVVGEAKRYLRWRMLRGHVPRALCCGGSNFQFMDEPQMQIKHAECDFGFVSGSMRIGSSCGSSPGVSTPANIRLYDIDGELIGRLTWWKQDVGKWDIEPLSYLPIDDD